MGEQSAPRCEHESVSGDDHRDLHDPEKVWRCDACGWRFTSRFDPLTGLHHDEEATASA